MADSPVLFTVLAIIITSNPSLHILVPFILVTSQWQAQYQAGGRIKGQTTTQKN